MQPDYVVLKAFDASDHLLMEQYYRLTDWYDGDIPLLDDEDQIRVKYRVHTIVGEQTDSKGDTELKWRNVYSKQGSLVSAFIWQDGSWVEEKLSTFLERDDGASEKGSAEG